MSVEEVLIWTRLAADRVGPTKMDRPEDVETNPVNGRTYVACTNNTKRTPSQIDEANPRANNKHGHIIEITPDRGDDTTTGFSWKIVLIAGDPADPSTYFSGYDRSEVSPISCPDNVAFDRDGNLWIATDGNALGHCDGLYLMPLSGPHKGHLQQFLSVPACAECCGPLVTWDQRTVLAAVQHPGEVDGASPATPAQPLPLPGRRPATAQRHPGPPGLSESTGRPPHGGRPSVRALCMPWVSPRGRRRPSPGRAAPPWPRRREAAPGRPGPAARRHTCRSRARSIAGWARSRPSVSASRSSPRRSEAQQLPQPRVGGVGRCQRVEHRKRRLALAQVGARGLARSRRPPTRCRSGRRRAGRPCRAARRTRASISTVCGVAAREHRAVARGRRDEDAGLVGEHPEVVVDRVGAGAGWAGRRGSGPSTAARTSRPGS